MKQSIIYLSFALLCIANNVFAQNGTYNCTKQAFSKTDSSENKSYSDKMIITIEINPALGGTISVNNLTQDFNFRYDILTKLGVVADKDKRTITTTYKAKMNQLNIQIGEDLLVAIVENMDNNKMGLWVFNSKYESYNFYYNLTKYK